jgi:transcriptional regulator of arginine metabolism
MDKKKRQFTILEIIQRENVGSQEDLQRALRKAGFPITQATLSRDLSEMGVSRIATPDGPRYSTEPKTDDNRIKALLSYEVRGVYASDTLLVVKTLAGRAQGVAELIDAMNSPHIIGTLAGDNTIFIAPKSSKVIPRLERELRVFITSVD